ncbi:ectomycorrhizas-regulated small secreted protein [Lyophyllum atratum]|nr:ectomycorrhizas-regulated small secreted protein [Lyophyllum atratum]
MKFFSLISLVSILAAVATSAHDDGHEARDNHEFFEARDYVDELATRDIEAILATRQLHEYAKREALFADISTRDIADELEHRLARRAAHAKKAPKPKGNAGSKGPPPYVCPYCGSSYDSAQAAIDCSKFCKAK